MTKKAEAVRRGRPAKPDAVRLRRPVAVRLRDELRADLEISASRHGRSVSEEIEARLEASLSVQNYLKQDWGNDVFMIARSLASSVAQIEHAYGSAWYESDEAVEVLKLTAAQTVENFKVGIRNELDEWAAIGKKAAADLKGASREEAAKIFAARDMRVLPRLKPTKDFTEGGNS
ncbi:hypothetical protein [Methylobacterium tardum]|uniref:Arc-like DNA binding domain-containing protein n=1 Tax=Methylobacterium tardum TaxID=374432 RepID=A0AA37TL94_9HYPH|nr:hypothetical protein [Methylobacterium tardum]URD34594.1 hypothetical protein M6G65_18530 [Methylobacterium tardum]GLS73039.1 hypothetical protein GCM10007890_50540 [Methylobacterium tardum]